MVTSVAKAAAKAKPRIIGQGRTANAVVLNSKDAHGPNGIAQSEIEGDNLDNGAGVVPCSA